MIIYVDIDETIALTPDCRNYSLASPIEENIKKINKLYDEGNTIVKLDRQRYWLWDRLVWNHKRAVYSMGRKISRPKIW